MITRYIPTPHGMAKNDIGEYMLYQIYRDTVDSLIAEIVSLNQEIKNFKKEKENAT